jgi:hypothetical protein
VNHRAGRNYRAGTNMYSTLWPQHFAADANLPAKAEGFAVTALLHLADLQRMLDEDLMEHAMPLSRVEGMSFDQAFLSNQAFLSHKAVLDPQVQADHGDAVSMAGMRALLRCVHVSGQVVRIQVEHCRCCCVASCFAAAGIAVDIGAVVHEAQRAGVHEAQCAGVHEAQRAGVHEAQ